MNKLLIFFILVVLSTTPVSAGLFTLNERVDAPFFGCSILGCTMQGSIDMNGFTIYNVTVVNASVVEFDPIFVAENSTIWNAINNKLNTSDQRYNDTGYIDLALTQYYTKNESDGRFYPLNSNPHNYINSSNNLSVNYSEYTNNANIQIYYNQIIDPPLYLSNFTNDLGLINESFANQTYYPLNTNPANYINDTSSIIIDYSQVNNSPQYLSNFSNDLGLINETWANQTYYPLNDNPAGYLNSTTLNLTNMTGPWVLKAGDTMTGNLNMSDRNITDVDYLFVHNISGRSPIYITSPVIGGNITADTFYGNINGQNGTIFGMTITNGSISNMHVSDSAIFNTSLIPELNYTWSLGNESHQWKDFYVGDLYATNISSPDIDNLYQLIYTVNNSSINNFTNSNTNYNITLVITLNDGSTLTTTIPYSPPYNDSWIQPALDDKLNITDQRYNDTALINATNESIWIELNLKLNASDQRYNDTGYIDGLLLNYYNTTEVDQLISNISLTPGPQGPPGVNGTNGTDGANLTMLNITNNLDGTYTWYFSDGTNYTTSNLTGPQGNPGINGINGTDGANLTMTNIIDNLDGTYTWVFSDGTNYTTNNLTGPQGTPGINGINGTNGESSYVTTINNGDGTYTWMYYYTNGTNYANYTTSNLTGPKGDQGIPGINGTDGINGTTYDVSGPYLYLINNTVYFNETPLQDYNDTAFIINNYYNKTESDGRYLQNYTETDPIFTLENTTIWNAINAKYNASNPAGYINETFANQTYYPLNSNPNNYINDTTTITINYSQVNNTPTNLSQFNNDVGYITNYTETDPIFTAENSTIWNAIDNKLNITDQRYNDTALINQTNYTIWLELDNKLNISDQRYNDTTLIISVNDSLNNETQYRIDNDSYLQNQIDNKLNITDQRYNDTLLINSTNESIWIELNNKLNISDQRYNDTSFIINNYYNKTESDGRYLQNYTETDPIFTAENTTIWLAIDSKYNASNPAGYINETWANQTYYPLNNNPNNYINDTTAIMINYSQVNNTPTNLSQFNNDVGYLINETDPIFTAENSTIWNAIDNKLNITDQRYNDTLLINSTNESIWIELNNKLNISDQRYNDTSFIINNYYNKTESDGRYLQNFTETDPVFTAENTTIWNAINDKLNTTDQRYNDTLLINATNESIWIELNLKLNITDQRYNDTSFIINNYYNKTESDGRYLQNFTETDPIFTLENTSIWNAINDKLNTSDQRYNDTLLINQTNESIWNELNIKLNISDQRYNDTALINATNYTIWLELDNKLNITDQRYNDTAFIINNYYNKTESDGRYLQNYTETDPIFTLENTTIWNAINTKLNTTDQRYNDTQLILDVNATIKQPTGPYLANNTSNFWVNDTYLNITINNISKIRTIIINLTCTAIGGTCNVTSGNITHEITRIQVTPTTPTNNYKFKLTEYPTTTTIIDQDRASHVGTWDIEKSYAINGQTQAVITNANTNELFTITLTYLTNGVTP